ncbi:unnamed protein product [Umbelopsis sp. WA50703]|jgi:hypothetical protein
MRKWRAENRDKNKRNDLRCRVYRLARQRFGEGDCSAKEAFIREEIAKRLGRRMIFLNDQAPPESPVPSLMPRRSSSTSESSFSSEDSYGDEFNPVYNAYSQAAPVTRQKKHVALPSISQCLMQSDEKFAMSLPLPKPSFSACSTPSLSPTTPTAGALPTLHEIESSAAWECHGHGTSAMIKAHPPQASAKSLPSLLNAPKNKSSKQADKFNILEDFVSTVLDYAGVRDKSL